MKRQLRACIWGIVGAAIGWSFEWLLQDGLGLHSLIYLDDGLRVYLTGFGAISGYAAGRWGWIAMMPMTDDWQDTFGPYPQVPEDRSSQENGGRPKNASQESKAKSDGVELDDRKT
jgi:hypothetical protein